MALESDTQPFGDAMRWTIEQVARAMGVQAPSSVAPLARLAGVSIDSRIIQPGQLFVAIHGPRHDGHAFVAGALGSGALAGVVARNHADEYSPDLRDRLFIVDDTLAALQQLAKSVCREWRKAKPGRLVGAVAGSVGKTTTKEILAALLGARFRVLKTEGNLNNEYGLPLTLLRLDDDDEAVVVELGMSSRGELAKLAQIAEPDVGVVTRIAIEHLEFFSSIDEIALAERELIENLNGQGSVAVLNADDDHAASFAEVAPGKVIWFGMQNDAKFRATNIEDRGLFGSAFDFVATQDTARLKLPLIGRHNVMNAVAALAAASVWGITASDAAHVFPKLHPVDKRGEVVYFEEGFAVINDSYNSSPSALAALADLLVTTPNYRRRILAAGEMLELGSSSAELHHISGKQAASTGEIDWIFGVRGDAAEIVKGAIAGGQPEDRTRFFENSEEAGKFISEFLQPGDLLLIKGSRGVKMEKILEAIRAGHLQVETQPKQVSGNVRPGNH